jgi:hypothetical protein
VVPYLSPVSDTAIVQLRPPDVRVVTSRLTQRNDRHTPHDRKPRSAKANAEKVPDTARPPREKQRAADLRGTGLGTLPATLAPWPGAVWGKA